MSFHTDMGVGGFEVEEGMADRAEYLHRREYEEARVASGVPRVAGSPTWCALPDHKQAVRFTYRKQSDPSKIRYGWIVESVSGFRAFAGVCSARARGGKILYGGERGLLDPYRMTSRSAVVALLEETPPQTAYRRDDIIAVDWTP